MSNVQYAYTYMPCMNGWGGSKSHVNNMKFKGAVTLEFRALGEEVRGAGFFSSLNSLNFGSKITEWDVFYTPVWYNLLVNPDLELLHKLYQIVVDCTDPIINEYASLYTFSLHETDVMTDKSSSIKLH
jgi:hypothetical protein